jgi:1,2-diacylglycerol-3-alpha-glucose alpha-1,2-galactosyltransferase
VTPQPDDDPRHANGLPLPANTAIDDTRPLTVNLFSETVGGTQGHGVHTAFLQTKQALERAGVDVRVNARERCDVTHIETMGFRALAVLLRDRRRAVVTAHIVPASLVGSFMWAPFWLPIGRAWISLFYSQAAEVLAVSPMVFDELERENLRVPFRLVPNTVDSEAFRRDPAARAAVRAELGVAENGFVAICVGQVQPRKGVDAFVAAARALPHVTFVWVGGMPFERLTAGFSRMQRLMAEAPPNCRFLGDQPHDLMPRWYSAADCLLFPSGQETFGLTVVEAAAAGLPLVLNDIEAYRALFGDDYIAVADGSYAAWIERLRVDEAFRTRFEQAALRVAHTYDTSRLADRLLPIYRGVVERAQAAEQAKRARRRLFTRERTARS